MQTDVADTWGRGGGEEVVMLGVKKDEMEIFGRQNVRFSQHSRWACLCVMAIQGPKVGPSMHL